MHDETDLHVSRQLRERGIWEPFETELLRRSLAPGSRFLDVGANLGYFTVLAAAWVGEAGHVYAFEPEPRNFALLESNVALNGLSPQTTLSRTALSENAGSGRLALHPDNLGDHQLVAHADAGNTIPVELVAGVDWFAGKEHRLDVVKIDVQGAEHAVIKGLLPLLAASGAGLHMLVELTPHSLRAAGTSGAELIASLETLQLPFHIVDHMEHRLVPSTARELATWCSNLDAYPEDEGFMNIFLGEAL